MKSTLSGRSHQRSRGFILVTSLVFLVVITLLAVSAMNSTTVQERMASNLREKSRARQASDSALREAEMRMRGPQMKQYTQPLGCKEVATLDANTGKTTGSLFIWCQGDMFPDDVKEESAAYLRESLWGRPQIQHYVPGDQLPNVGFMVEELRNGLPDTLDPDTNARGIGIMLYRITARGKGQNPAAISVTQSIFGKRYYGAN